MRFGGITAVNGVDLAVEPGQIFSVIGPNGAGKTTVFNAVTGIYEPTNGTVLFRGIGRWRRRSHVKVGCRRLVDRPVHGRAGNALCGERRYALESRGPWTSTANHAQTSRTGTARRSTALASISPAASARRPSACSRRARLGAAARSCPWRRRTRRTGRHHASRHRPHLPEHPSLPGHDRDREHHGRHDAPIRTRCDSSGSHRREEGREEASCSRSSASPASTTNWPATSPTATSGGSKSPARWPPTRSSCCSTNPPPG